jgi:hypothetical protein
MTMRLVSGNYPDNVVRRQEFEARHPDIVIRCENRGLCWYASRDGVDIVQTIGLGRLLDRLEILTGEQPS